MSYSACIHGGVCTGCMECRSREEEILICADCGEEIDEEDGVYEDGNDILCSWCLLDRFRR